MTLKFFITVAFLLLFVQRYYCIIINPLVFGAYARNNFHNHLFSRNSYFLCLKSTKSIYPKNSLSLTLVDKDSRKDEVADQHLVVLTFNNIYMTVFPPKHICVFENGLKNFILSQNSGFESMISIAIWFCPCMSIQTSTDKHRCIEQRLKAIQSIDIDSLKVCYGVTARDAIKY